MEESSAEKPSRAYKFISGITYVGILIGAIIGCIRGYQQHGWSGIPVGLMVMSLVGGIAALPVGGVVWASLALIARFATLPAHRQAVADRTARSVVSPDRARPRTGHFPG